MIQISLGKLAEMFEQHGMDLADHPELAAKCMAVNDQLASIPGLDEGMLQTMLGALLSPTNDAPREEVQ